MHTVAIDEEGYLWSWGDNQFNTLGNENINGNINKPVKVDLSVKFKTVSCGWYTTLLIDQNDHLWAMGPNFSGEAGSGNDNSITKPILIDNSRKWKKIICGLNHSLALDENGILFGSGYNGVFGLTDKFPQTEIQSFSKLSDDQWTEIASGNAFSVAINKKGRLIHGEIITLMVNGLTI